MSNLFPAAKILLGEHDELVRAKGLSSIAPCEQKLLSDLEMLEILRTKVKTEAQWWDCVGKICQKSYWAFLRIMLGYKWIDPYWHGEVLTRFVEDTKGFDRVIILPRDSGKTACITVPYVVYTLVNNHSALTQVTNAVDTKAMSMVSASAKIIENNRRIHKAYPGLRKDSKRWGNTNGYQIDLALAMGKIDGSVERADPSIMGYGVRGNITGSHVNLQIHDDLLNHEVLNHPERNDKAKSFLREAFRCCVASGEVIVCGTRWLYHDLYGDLIKADLVAAKSEFKVLKQGIFNKQGEIVWKERTFVDLQGKQRKAGYTEEQVEGYKKDPNFAALYLSEPTSGENQALDTDLIHVFKLSDLPFDVGEVSTVYIEGANAGTMVAESIRDMCREEGKKIRIENITARSQNKDLRIKSYMGPFVNAGKFHICDSSWRGTNSLGQQIRDFPAGKKDIIDAASYVCRVAKEPPIGELPRIYIVCDPAFSNQGYSDESGMAVGLRWQNEIWILETCAIKTAKVTTLGRNVIKLHDKWNSMTMTAKTANRNIPRYNGLRTFASKWRSPTGFKGKSKNSYNSFHVDTKALGWGTPTIDSED